jgi:hypothetical protein
VSKKKTPSLILGLASYPWKNNSCWLDTSFKLTFIAVMHDFPAFSACCKFLPAASGLCTVYKLFEQRQLIRSDDLECSATLGNQQDEI